MPDWRTVAPRNDKGYFESMSVHLFSSGLNWQVVDKKKAAFRKAFADFDPDLVARYTERDVKRLLRDTGIVRNERKIRSTIQNAAEFLEVQREYGSFKGYLSHFGKDEIGLQNDLQDRFHHMGPSTTRMFLWSVGYPLTPNAEEKKWMASHKM